MDEYYYLDGSVLNYEDESRTLHRLDGPAVELISGRRDWYINGQLHRTDGPARHFPSWVNLWYQNGFVHRLDGPAIEWVNGDMEWYINGDEFTKEKFERTSLTMQLSGLLYE